MPDITPLIKNGDSANRVDIIIVAEGYTAAERAKFIGDAQVFLNSFLGDSNARLNAPFSNYKKFFNASALFFASAESGTDQPNKSISVNTYFNSTQHGSDGRLLYGDTFAVENEVAKVFVRNERELIIVLVNTPLYGGAGGTIAWASAGNALASELALHEIGHSYAGLQDEYVDAEVAKSFPTTNQNFLDSPHVTDSLSRIPWKDWLGYLDGELGVVGTYEGGYYRANGIWRATQNSKMLFLSQPFSAPEKEAFALQYYANIGDYLTVSTIAPGIYSANTPDPTLFSFNWKYDGKALPKGGAVYDAYANGGYAIGNKLSVVTTDNTGLIRKNLAQTSQTEQINIATAVKDNTSIVTYTVASSDAGSVLRFGDADNVVSIKDATLPNVYIDGGKGNDSLKFGFSLNSGINFKIQEIPGGSFTLKQQDGSLLATYQIESLKFDNVVVNTQVHSNAQTISRPVLNTLLDIYVAFFNRVPDADGLNYWIDSYKAGMGLNKISESFFSAATEKSAQTGYAPNLTNADFINKIYVNALGRKDGADSGGLDYWSKQLESGAQTRGTMVLSVVGAVHQWKGDPVWGWVADLLDNKIQVAYKFAVDWGLNYSTPEESILKTMQIASLITPTDTTAAIQLIGIAEGQIQFM
ncbi:M64 family metallopeptidase [Undibacterium sp. Di24W]|uniref:M64 family metallopeptidase n=1 Tax=Undibacterium sp. Di24W TaxID=3413033 RepID=UPI003BF1B682